MGIEPTLDFRYVFEIIGYTRSCRPKPSIIDWLQPKKQRQITPRGPCCDESKYAATTHIRSLGQAGLHCEIST
jgi:hypothetical protein